MQINLTLSFQGAFTSLLAGSSSGSSSPARGTAVVTYDCETAVMEYVVVHNVEDASSGAVFVGAENSILFSLSG